MNMIILLYLDEARVTEPAQETASTSYNNTSCDYHIQGNKENIFKLPNIKWLLVLLKDYH